MRKLRYLIVPALAVLVTLVTGAQADVIAPKPNYLQPAAPGVEIKKILSTGDIIGDTLTGYQMSGIPDGLGAYRNRGGNDDDNLGGGDRNGTFTVVMNHELGKSFPQQPPNVDARISRLVVDRQSLKVEDAEYLFTGNEGFERFCSATLATIFGRPWYFTGEEAIPQPNQPPGPAHDGSSIVMDPETGMWRETAHFGHFQHENVVPLRLSKWVFLSSEDDFRAGTAFQPSYLYAYIGDNFNRTIRGRTGSLYVWKADNPAKAGNANIVKDESVPGHFVPLTQAENADDVTLKNAATAKGAFKFDRLEDIAVKPDVRGRTYIADTGKPPATLRGRVFQFDIDPRDPTKATLKMILNADAPDNDDLVNPDNMDASARVLVIQEDRESAFRNVPNRVLVYDFASKTIRTVATVQAPGLSAPFNWESSGVINARSVLGANWWLLDVQAHTLRERQPGGPTPFGTQPTPNTGAANGEDGQLLAIRIPNSTSGDEGDDDD